MWLETMRPLTSERIDFMFKDVRSRANPRVFVTSTAVDSTRCVGSACAKVSYDTALDLILPKRPV